jgi:CBS domain-containing protein
MKSNVTPIAADESLASAVQIMWDCDCGSVPAREPGGDRVFGMIADRDICIATWSKGLAPASIRVLDAMSSQASK